MTCSTACARPSQYLFTLCRSHPMSLDLRRVVLTLAFSALAATSLRAQDDARPGIERIDNGSRHGFWGVFSLGAGGERVNFDNDNLGWSDTRTKPTVALRLGGTLNPHVRLGGEYSAWVNDRDGLREVVGGLFLMSQLYPSARNGLFVKAGIGIATSSVDDGFGYADTDYGFGLQVGLGYDLRLARRLYLVPTAELAGYRLSADGAPSYSERVGSLNLGIAYQH